MENWFLEVIQDVHTKIFLKFCLIFGLSFLSRQDEPSRVYLRSKQHVLCVHQVLCVFQVVEMLLWVFL